MGLGCRATLPPLLSRITMFPCPIPVVGAGAYVAGNIIWDCPRLVANYSTTNDTVIFENNLLPMEWNGLGSNNVVADPRLNSEPDYQYAFGGLENRASSAEPLAWFASCWARA